MNQQFQLSDKSVMMFFLTINLLVTGCDTTKRSLPSFAEKPRVKINLHQEYSQTPKRPLNPFVNLEPDIATPDPIAEERQ